MIRPKTVVSALILSALLTTPGLGQHPVRGTSTLVAPMEADSSRLSALAWRTIGPVIPSGRIVDIAVSELTDRTKGARVGKTFYVATATGGVWKSTDGGTTFEPVFDRVGPNSIGAVAVAPSNPEVVWVGTGEANNQRSVSFGDGIYKSENGGKRWEHMGLQSSQHISRIAIHPTDPDIVYVAANGPLWESGGERGLYKTADGGVTWTSVLMISEHTGVTDVVLDPQDPDVVYASAFQRQRKAYDFVGGGPESGIHKSMDGGASWEELTVGLPDGDMGRIGLTIAASQPRTLYAVIETRDWGVWRSDDYGASWRRTAGRVFGYPWYMGVIKADPTEPERVWVLGVPLLVSEDGGENFETRGATTHVDHHAMWIDPTDSDNMILGNDGGLYFSHDQGFNWRIAVNLPVAQFYAIGTDMREPYHVYGGTQDNNVWTAPNMSRDRSGVTMSDWTNVCCGDGFYSVIDPVEPHIVYSESQYGAIIRFDANTGEAKGIRPPESLVGEPYRWNWSAPILISPHDRKTIYFAANYLFRSPDRGDGWEVLGGDMTRGIDRDTMMMMGRRWGPGSVALHSGVAEYGNISTLDESPLREGLLYVGTDDGLIQISKDGGESWTKVESFPGVPALTYVSRVTASSHDEGTVYATFDGHRDNDFKPYIHKSTDYGESWTSIALGMPEFGSTHVIREHPENPRLLFVGTEFGVHFSTDGGERWRSLRNNMPIVIVRDLLIHPRDNDLVVGTHGRGIYILDDITPLVELAPAEETPLIHLFPVDPVTQFNQSSRKIGDARGPGAVADAFWAGENPVVGALIAITSGTP